MDPSVISWEPVQAIAPGTYRATLIDIQLTLGGRSNKPVFVWSFELDGGQVVTLWTSKRGEGARKGYECTKALGVSRTFTRDEVVGKQCWVELVSRKDGWTDIVRILPA